MCALSLYSVLKQGDFIDYQILGNVEKVQFFKNYPCEIKPKYLDDVFFVKFAYHIFELGDCLIFHRQSRDFSEMILHHIITTFLISISCTSNQMVIGAAIMLVHDTSDIFVIICKLSKDLASDFSIILCWLMMFGSWAYLRLYYFPFHLISAFYYGQKNNPHFFIQKTFTSSMVFVLTLYSLHIYWTFCMIKAFVGKFMTKKADGKILMQKF